MSMTNDEVLAGLSKVYVEWCNGQGLPEMACDELLGTSLGCVLIADKIPKLSEYQTDWLEMFQYAWELVEGRKN